MLVIPVGAAGGFSATLLPRCMLLLPLLATVGITFGPFLKPIFAPMEVAALKNTWRRDVCIQSTLSSCGPASTATVLRALGAEVGEGELAKEAHTYVGGTEAWYLARAIRSRGLGARFVMNGGGFNEAIRFPAIVGVTVNGRGHFIAVLSRTGDVYEIGDPMVGPEKRTRVALEQRYGFTGFAIEVSREGRE